MAIWASSIDPAECHSGLSGFTLKVVQYPLVKSMLSIRTFSGKWLLDDKVLLKRSVTGPSKLIRSNSNSGAGVVTSLGVPCFLSTMFPEGPPTYTVLKRLNHGNSSTCNKGSDSCRNTYQQ